MPENPNPYMDPNMNPNGYVPNYGQGYVDETNPYVQQGTWNQGQFGVPQQGYPDAAPQEAYPNAIFNPENMMSPQDIYANQASQGGMPYGVPYPDPNAGYVDSAYGGQPYVDPYIQQDPYGQPYPYEYGQQPYYDPSQMAQPGQMGQQPMAPYGAPMPDQSGQIPPVASVPVDQFGNPLQGRQDVAEPQIPYDAQTAQQQAQQAAQVAQQPVQQSASTQATGQQAPVQAQQVSQQPSAQQQAAQQPAVQQAAAQQQVAAQKAVAQQTAQIEGQESPQEAASKKGRRQKAPKQQPQVQPMPVVGVPAMDPSKATGGRATLALILSILSIILALVPPVGLVLAIIARKLSKSYRRNGGRAAKGEAAGVFGMVGLVFSILMLAVLVCFIGYVMGANKVLIGPMTPINFYNNSPIGHLIPVPAG